MKKFTSTVAISSHSTTTAITNNTWRNSHFKSSCFLPPTHNCRQKWDQQSWENPTLAAAVPSHPPTIAITSETNTPLYPPINFIMNKDISGYLLDVEYDNSEEDI